MANAPTMIDSPETLAQCFRHSKITSVDFSICAASKPIDPNPELSLSFVATNDTPFWQVCLQDFSAGGAAAAKASSADVAQSTLSQIRRRAKATSDAEGPSSRRSVRRRSMSDESAGGSIMVGAKKSWFA